jgi:GTP-binding protein YchF
VNIGIVGLPNVGKTTLFNALANAHAHAESYPFCTVEPNLGVVHVPDERLARIADLIKPRRVVPATVEFVDIAGLVRNAHEGEGLGNQFLSHIRDVDAIAHVVRCFRDENVADAHGTGRPRTDVEVVELELLLADLAALQRRLHNAMRLARSGDAHAAREAQLFERLQKVMEAGIPLRQHFVEEPPSHDDEMILCEARFLTAKPVMYVANIGEVLDDDTRVALDELRAHVEEEDSALLTVNAEIEAELAELAPAERKEFQEELGIDVHGLHDVIAAGYRLLDYVGFYTIVSDETRAWAVTRGTTVPAAAGKIHTDMEHGFIRADVVKADALLRCGSFAHAREQGALRSEGRNYVVEDGDVIYVHFQT